MRANPRFKPRVEWVRVHPTVKAKGYSLKCRITDARDLTPEKAVEKALQKLRDFHEEMWVIKELAKAAGMSARVVNGKVRVRRVKQ